MTNVELMTAIQWAYGASSVVGRYNAATDLIEPVKERDQVQQMVADHLRCLLREQRKRATQR